MDSFTDPLIGKEIDGFQIQEVLGRGGMGIVYRAEQLALSRVVALKMIDPMLARDKSFLRRFKSEAQALARINSPNIVSIYTLRETDLGLFIAMEYVDGGTLSDLVLEEGNLPWLRAMPLIKQMLLALHSAHSVGVTHRDIKLHNIMLNESGQIKVTDFGLAKVRERGRESTMTQGIAGTLYFMSPEQVKGLRNVDHRSDLYSLGMVIYEMLVGRLPFEKGASEFTIMKQIVEEKLPPATNFCPTLPKALTKIISKTLEKDPEDRYQSAQEMLEAIEAFETRQTGKGATYKASESDTAPQRRWPLYASLVALLVIITIGGYFLMPSLPTTEMVTSEDVPLEIPVHEGDPAAAGSTVIWVSTPKNGSVDIIDGGLGLRYTPATEFSGRDQFTYTLSDHEGSTSRARIAVMVSNVNDAPAVEQPLVSQTRLLGGGPFQINLSEVFQDVDDTNLRYASEILNDSIATLQLDGPNLTIEPIAAGSTMVTAVAEDESGNRTPYRFPLVVSDTENLGPEVRTRIRDQRLQTDGRAFTIDLRTVFNNLGDNPLRYETVTANRRIATARVSNNTLTVQPVGAGTVEITVKASNDGASVQDAFRVTVQAPPETASGPVAETPTPMGTLNIRSTPPGARIVLDGKRLNITTPATLEKPPATYDIALELDGHEPYRTSVVVAKDTPTNVTGQMSLQMGILEVSVRPWGNLYVDGERLFDNVSFKKQIPLTATRHLVKIEHPVMGRVWEQEVTITPGDLPYPIFVNFSEKVPIRVTAKDADDNRITGDIYVDNMPTGFRTPQRIEVTVGLHTIEVRRDGYTQVEIQGNVVRRGSNRVNIDPSRGDAALFAILKKTGS